MVRAGLTVTLGVLAVAAMTACATSSPAEQALRQRSREAAIVCAKKFPDVGHWWDRWSGALMIYVNLRDYPTLSGDQSGFAACVDVTARQQAHGLAVARGSPLGPHGLRRAHAGKTRRGETRVVRVMVHGVQPVIG